MNSMATVLNQYRNKIAGLMWLPALLSRIVVGWVFVESGWGKLHHLNKVTAFFTDLGLPLPGFQACLVASTEFSCGILLLAGLCTLLASVPLSIIMFVAIATAKREDLHGFSDLTGFPEFLYIVLLAWLIINGAGILSLDFILNLKIKNKI